MVKEELTIQQIQKISLEILKIIADICEQNNFRYTLMYGTLLGAVRHKGYIPWDDDVDIMMPRRDYNQLLEYLRLHGTEYPNLQVFNPDECAQYPYMITRISDSRYIIKSENEKDCGMGVFIDIYPFDALGNTKKEAAFYAKRGDVLSTFCSQANKKRYAVETTESLVKQIIKLPVFLLAKMIGKSYFQKKLKALENKKEYDQSKYVGCVVWLSGGEKDIFLREWFEETVLVPYEQYMFRIPVKYDEILEHIYGDYMQLPPEENQIGHHAYKVYKK